MSTPARPRRRDERSVVFRFRPPRPARLVELRGDMVHWTHPVPLARLADGGHGATVPLGVGTYVYKFRLDDGDWLLDPDNPRTRGADGVVNSLLVVGGTDEPVLHAPAAPWLSWSEQGQLVVRAGLRRGAGSSLNVRWLEGAGGGDTPMRVVAHEDQHTLLEAALPASAANLEYLFVLPDGHTVGAPGGAGQAFALPRDLPRDQSPAWWRDAVVYTILLDRYRIGGRDSIPPALDPSMSLDASWGGDLAGVIEALPYLIDLGVTVLHLTPVALSRSAHRYDAIDPRVVDPRLGGDHALAGLLTRAHDAGLRVILDVTLTHVHRDFEPFREVCESGPAAPSWEWFRARRFPFTEGFEPGYDHYQKGQWEEPLLATEHPEVAAFLVGTFERWARLGVDGFRLDAVADVPLDLARRIVRSVRALRPDAALYGELLADNPHRWTSGAGLDAVTDFVAAEALREWLGPAQRIGASRLADVIGRRRIARGGPGHRHLGFSATHDQARIASLTSDPRRARLAALAVLLGPAVPAILYGDEVGLCSPGPHADFEGAWRDRMPMSWAPDAWDHETLSLYRAAIALRKDRTVLSRGDEDARALGDADDVLLIRRRRADEVVDVILHGADGERVVDLPDGAPSGAAVLLGCGDAVVSDRRVALGPWSAVVLDRVLSADLVQLVETAADHADDLATLAFDEGLQTSVGLPPRLYCTVTESCNIRCAHCITDAPARTREGRARTMRPWVVERLGEALAAARYVGFSHGGESMFAPVFYDLLAALRRARAGRPGRTDVHLLTNGMLLASETTRRLVDLGVTSLAVSLDGADAATNDAIRIGGRFATIVANVREAVRLRGKGDLDLRIGLSTVVGRTNLGGLARLGRLAVELGVDWLKVEETYAANPWARRDQIAPDAPAVRDAVDALRSATAGSGLVLVDHLATRPALGSRCDCDDSSADEVDRAFRIADDFANRARFRVCRMPWEQVSVDPDGTVRPVDYDHEPLGSLADASMLELWNGPVARRLRASVLGRHGRASWRARSAHE